MNRAVVLLFSLVLALIIGVISLGRGNTDAPWTMQQTSFYLPSASSTASIKEGGIEEAAEGRKLFIDPDGRFSFQYESHGNDYTVEKIKSDGISTDVFSICNSLSCYFVGVEVSPLRVRENGEPVYDYRGIDYNQGVSEPIAWNGYSAYRVAIGWKEYPERYLFIHIPHSDELFTLYRNTKDDQFVMQQFEVLSKTFRLLR